MKKHSSLFLTLVSLFAIGSVASYADDTAKAEPAKTDAAKAEKKEAAAAPAPGKDFKDVKKLEKKDIKKGKGKVAKAGKPVVVHYTGWLTNGTEFDSSVRRGQPFTFNLGKGEVIKGWDEGVEGMKVGGKRMLHIPSDKGYGENGAPPVIPANATLHFEVELIDVKS